MNAASSDHRRKNWIKAAIIIALAVPILGVILYLFHWSLIFQTYNFCVEKLSSEVHLPRRLAQAVAAIFWLPLFYLVRQALNPFSRRAQYIGLGGISAYVAVFSLLAWQANAHSYFTERPWYLFTPDGRYKFYETGGLDPVYGVERKRVTPEVVRNALHSTNIVARTSLEDFPALFNTGDGSPLVWYSGDPDGSARYFPQPGFDPQTQEDLKPLTREIVTRVRAAVERRKAGELHRTATADRKTRIDEAEARETSWRDRYIRAAQLAAMKADESSVVVAFNPSEPMAQQLENSVVENLRSRGRPARGNLLLPAAFEADFYGTILSGDAATLKRLGLATRVTRLVLGQLRSDEPTPGAYKDMVKVTAELTYSVVEIATGAVSSSKVQAVGTGFDLGAARQMAERRLLEALFNEKSMAEL